MNISEQLRLLKYIKYDMKSALTEKQTLVSNNTPFSSYADIINSINCYSPKDNSRHKDYVNRIVSSQIINNSNSKDLVKRQLTFENLGIKIPLKTNYTNVGGVTISNDYIASGFASNKYLKLPSAFSPSNNDDWEIVIKFLYKTSSNNQRIFGSVIGTTESTRYGIGIYVNTSNNIRYNEAETSSSWAGDVGGNITLSNNTIYYLKIVGSGSTRTFYLSTDGETWIEDFTITYSQICTDGYNFCSLGTRYVEGSSSYDIFQGSIYLKDCYIKLNNQLWWQGITPERIIL